MQVPGYKFFPQLEPAGEAMSYGIYEGEAVDYQERAMTFLGTLLSWDAGRPFRPGVGMDLLSQWLLDKCAPLSDSEGAL